MRYECYTNETSATRVKKIDSDNDTTENIFSQPYIYLWQVKDYKERKNFVLEIPFGKVLFSCQNAFEKCITKTEFCNGKSYIKKLCNRL